MNSYQEYKNFKFHQSMKAFKRDHPYIKIKAPRMKKDRNPPPHLNKENWIAKSEKEIIKNRHPVPPTGGRQSFHLLEEV